MTNVEVEPVEEVEFRTDDEATDDEEWPTVGQCVRGIATSVALGAVGAALAAAADEEADDEQA